ncbi:MAG: 30S ribosomal protein S2 [Alphaproteobacteria bacterium]|nr:30S ribosomal protein S2 [Alphaproteobacteria bacterium]
MSVSDRIPHVSIPELISVGAHFGHKTMRWNPQMKSYIYGEHNGVHILDLQQTVPLFRSALQKVYETVRGNGRVLFIGTKRQATEIIAEEAKRCGQYFVNHRWLGGMLTNWKTISLSIRTLQSYEEKLNNPRLNLSKKERLDLSRQYDKLQRSLGGIRDMGGIPDLVFIVDTNKEHIAVKEAQALGIPVIAILDSNSTPTGITYPVPANDDASKAIQFYCQAVANAVIAGIEDGLSASGVDLGASEDVPGDMFDGESSDKDDKRSARKRPAKPAPNKGPAKKPVRAKKPTDSDNAASEE